MAVIPRSIYRVVEWHLHNVPRLVSAAREDELSSLLPSGMPVITGGKGRHSDRTADAGIRLATDAGRMAQWQRWMDCINATRRHFEGGAEQDMAGRYYGQNTTVLSVAEAMFVDKQTVNRYRDRYVAYLALAAACEGLIDMNKAGPGP
ncbi:MAG: hypothetical protein ACOX7B_03405 [Christensenellales bacterium]|jgi:hypothetical protein